MRMRVGEVRRASVRHSEGHLPALPPEHARLPLAHLLARAPNSLPCGNSISSPASAGRWERLGQVAHRKVLWQQRVESTLRRPLCRLRPLALHIRDGCRHPRLCVSGRVEGSWPCLIPQGKPVSVPTSGLSLGHPKPDGACLKVDGR
jgi:hypothetical protein